MTVTLDANPIREALATMLEPGQVTELRALNYTRPGSTYSTTISGYFDDLNALATEAAKLSARSSGVYFIPNPVNPVLLARAWNKAKPTGKGDLRTSDRDVSSRKWLLVDCDPQRPSGISATDREREFAFDRVRTITDYLGSEGWPEPVQADSGNGAHLMFRVDEPTEDGGLVKTCLEALAARFNDDAVHVDTTVFNPARIWKLPGTWARKGENVPERPHRLAALLHVPKPIGVVTTEQLRALAAQVKRTDKPTELQARGGFDLESWIDTHLTGTRHKRTAEGDVWTIEVCPFNPEHNRGEAFIIRRSDGVIGAGCKHESCKWNWHELRAKFEPGLRHTAYLVTGEKQDFPLTDLGNAERLIGAHGENLRFDVDAGRWLVWNGKRWEYDGKFKVNKLAVKVVKSMPDLLKNLDGKARDELYHHIGKSGSKPRLDAMVKAAAENVDGVPVQAADLDRELIFLNCLNGTIDLRTGTLKPHTREDLITKLAPVEYDPNAEAPRWNQFLEEVFQGDAEIIAFVKRMAGYCLTGSTQEQCVFMAHWQGRKRQVHVRGGRTARIG